MRLLTQAGTLPSFYSLSSSSTILTFKHNNIIIMKTGKILLTALASLAISTAAFAQKPTVYAPAWVPQNPQAGEAMYVNLVNKNPYGQEGSYTTNSFLLSVASNGIPYPQEFNKHNEYALFYQSFSNVSSPDENTWLEYGLDGVPHETEYPMIESITWDAGKMPSIKCDYEYIYTHSEWLVKRVVWTPGTTPTLDPKEGKVVDKYWTYELKESQKGGVNYIPTTMRTHAPNTVGRVMGQSDVYMSKPFKDGTYLMATQATMDGYWVRVAFISQDQYEFHVAACEAADYLNDSKYAGSVFWQLKGAIESQGRDWKNQKIAVETLLAQYKADEARVNAALDALPATIELGTIAINGEAKNVYTLKNLPAVWNQEFNFRDYVTLATTSADFKVKEAVYYDDPTATLNFAPVEPQFNFNNRMPYVEYLTINAMGITKEIELVGRNPEMSWTLNELTEEQTINFTERGTTVVPFYTFGYDGMYENGADGVFHEKDVTITQIEGATDEYYIELQKVAAPNEDHFAELNLDNEPKPMYGVRAYQLVVKFNGNKIGANDAVFEIADHFTGNKIQLNIRAAQVALLATDLKGNAIDKLHFPEEGGEKIIAVHYAGFQSVNEIQKIATAFPYPFTAEFISAPDNTTSSNRVEGTGTVYLKISCAPVEYNDIEFQIIEKEGSVSYGHEAVVPVALTRTKTLLSTKGVNHMDTEIEMGGEKFESEIEFAAIDFVNYYSLDDIRVYTDVDVFVLNDVIRWHKGSMKDGNFDTLGTVALKYRPSHADVITEGNLYIENIKNHKMIIIPLVGLATSQAKINELNGTTGIENIAAEGAAQNGEMFNVAGQRVNGAAKGLVIKNGKKFIVK